MSWTRRDFLLQSAVLGAALTAGCTSTVRGAPRPDPAATRPPETSTSASADAVTIGILAFQPYTVEQGGEVSGPVPDVARAVLEKLDITEVDVVTFRDETGILVGLAAGQFDLVGGLTIRPDLCDQFVYSTPDTVSGTAFIVPNGNPKGLRNYAEAIAARAKVAVMTGLPEHQDALKAGVPAANVVQVPVPHQLVDAVRNGQADCAAYDDITARDLVRTLGDGQVTTADGFMPEERSPYVGAYAFPRESSELLEPFNAALRELHDSGEWLELVEPYGFTQLNDPSADLRQARVCGN
jgi:polar amino acid transport system substrate-binding protein